MKSYLQNGTPTNTRLKWWPGDTKDLYNQNLKKYQKKLKSLGWDKDSISYVFDNYGFRNDYNFDTSTYYNLVLGCSHTFGVGVNENDIWYNVLKEKFNEPFYNAAVAGSSIGSCYRSLDGLIDKGMKVKRVFMLTPSSSRNEIYNHTSFCCWEPVAAYTTQYPIKILKVKLNENELYKFYRTSLLSIKYICKEHNIELIDIPTEDEKFKKNEFIFNSKEARDLSHPGISSHKLIGEIFYDEYCKRYNSKS